MEATPKQKEIRLHACIQLTYAYISIKRPSNNIKERSVLSSQIPEKRTMNSYFGIYVNRSIHDVDISLSFYVQCIVVKVA